MNHQGENKMMTESEKIHADELTQELTAYPTFKAMVLSTATPTLRFRTRKDGDLDRRHTKYNWQICKLQQYCTAVGKRYWDGQ